MSFRINSNNFPSNILVNDKLYSVIVEEKAKKNSSASVQGDKIIIRLSNKLWSFQKQKHVEFLLSSIEKKLKKNKSNHCINFSEVFKKGYFYLNGECFYIQVEHVRKKFFFKYPVFYVGPSMNIFDIEKKIQKKLCEYYQELVEEKVREVNLNSFRYNYKKISLKVLNSTWGHCSYNNNLMFNIRLLNAPNDVFEYVIIHELAHIAVKDHSKRFWSYVGIYCPKYKELRKDLKLSPPSLYKL